MKEQFQFNDAGLWQGSTLMWQEIKSRIVCRPKCQGNDKIKRYERRIEHDTVIYIAECRKCGAKAIGWGYDT
jgi:hypothetical protein